MRRGNKNIETHFEKNGNFVEPENENLLEDSHFNERSRTENSPKSKYQSNQLWGRHYISRTFGEKAFTLLSTLGILIFCPFIVIFYWTSCAYFQCDLIMPSSVLFNKGMFFFYQKYFPTFKLKPFLILLGWYFFQIILYVYLPGKNTVGQLTPAGKLPKYKINGLLAYVLSHSLFLILCLYDRSILTFIPDNWGSLLISCNILAYFISIYVFIKGIYFPTDPEDCKFSDSWLYNFYMGIELNPRIGKHFDFKLFHNGRPGIVAWSLINISFAAFQYRKFGAISNSMVLVIILQGIYALDFFCFEDWYLRTLDIAHDHFGFYLAWGDLVWLPFMYTLQGYYLSRNFIHLNKHLFMTLLLFGLLGYYIFRVTNNQKDQFRIAFGKGTLYFPKYWFYTAIKPAQYLAAMYETTDGKTHLSGLLTSGFWGVARHFNYTGDLILATCMSLACGDPVHHFYPYFHLLFMLILLLNRIYRDEARCKAKYGSYWNDYCKIVPYRLIPRVY